MTTAPDYNLASMFAERIAAKCNRAAAARIFGDAFAVSLFADRMDADFRELADKLGYTVAATAADPRTFADGIAAAVALLTEWADEADGNRLDADSAFRADLFRRERDAHSEAAEALQKMLAPAATLDVAAE